MDLQRWIQRCYQLRQKVVRRDRRGSNKYLLANFKGTKQQKDIEAKTPLINDFFRIKTNVCAWDPATAKKKGMELTDFTDDSQVFGSMQNEFDIPYWAFHAFLPGPLADCNNAFTYQLKACNLFCPWCFVDDRNKNGKIGTGRFFAIKDIMNSFEEEAKSNPLYIIRSSGGEPTLAVEQWLEILREFERRFLEDKICLWGDTNLTTGHFIDWLEEERIVPRHIRDKIGTYRNPQILCSFKGTDTKSFLEAVGFVTKDNVPNMKYAFLEKERWYSFTRLLESKIEVYPFIYAPNPDTLTDFMNRGERLYGPGFLVKTWIFRLKLYGPEKQRLIARGIDPEAYQKWLDENFLRSEEIMRNLLWSRFRLNYKTIPRAGIELKIPPRSVI